MLIKVSELEKLILSSLKKKFDEEESRLICNVIMFGQLSGNTSHGIVRLFVGNEAVLNAKPTAKPKFIHKTNISTLIEGNGNPGMLLGALGCNEVIRLAKKNNIGIVGTKRSFSSSGCLAYYLEKISKENLIAIIMAESPQSTPPYGGYEPIFGTNPISFGIPADPKPLIFDMATSAITFGDILKAKALGKQLPENTVLDSEGNPTTDPVKAIDGSTLSFGNHYKSAGLAMMVEILAGILPGAGFGGLNSSDGWGNLFIAFSPNLLSSEEEFKRKTKELIEKVRHSKTKSGEKVRIMGEQTISTRDNNIEKGEIEIEDKLIDELKKFAE